MLEGDVPDVAMGPECFLEIDKVVGTNGVEIAEIEDDDLGLLAGDARVSGGEIGETSTEVLEETEAGGTGTDNSGDAVVEGERGEEVSELGFFEPDLEVSGLSLHEVSAVSPEEILELGADEVVLIIPSGAETDLAGVLPDGASGEAALEEGFGKERGELGVSEEATIGTATAEHEIVDLLGSEGPVFARGGEDGLDGLDPGGGDGIGSISRRDHFITRVV